MCSPVNDPAARASAVCRAPARERDAIIAAGRPARPPTEPVLALGNDGAEAATSHTCHTCKHPLKGSARVCDAVRYACLETAFDAGPPSVLGIDGDDDDDAGIKIPGGKTTRTTHDGYVIA